MSDGEKEQPGARTDHAANGETYLSLNSKQPVAAKPTSPPPPKPKG